jgi:hypothetical protein
VGDLVQLDKWETAGYGAKTLNPIHLLSSLLLQMRRHCGIAGGGNEVPLSSPFPSSFLYTTASMIFPY